MCSKKLSSKLLSQQLAYKTIQWEPTEDGGSRRAPIPTRTAVGSQNKVNVALKKARDAYRDRRQSACGALNQLLAPRGGGCWSGPDAVNVWVRLPPGVDSKHIQERSAAVGVRIADGEPFFICSRPKRRRAAECRSVEAEDAAKAGKIVGQAILEQSLKTLILRKSN
jgi:DNA-binding transcriptional MocR family regulator